MDMPSEIVMRHRTPQFMHVFAGDGYSAGYYSYLWSDTLTADAWEAFLEADGPWDPVARALRSTCSAGNSVDPVQGWPRLPRPDAGVEPLMRKRGFPSRSAAPTTGLTPPPARRRRGAPPRAMPLWILSAMPLPLWAAAPPSLP
jgi:peptidyl-dipeptidase Dcp